MEECVSCPKLPANDDMWKEVCVQNTNDRAHGRDAASLLPRLNLWKQGNGGESQRSCYFGISAKLEGYIYGQMRTSNHSSHNYLRDLGLR